MLLARPALIALNFKAILLYRAAYAAALL